MATDSKNVELGEYIRTRRLSQGISVRTAAASAGIDHSYWHKLEAGVYQSPAPRYLQAIARTLECPLEDLYSLSGYTPIEALPTLSLYMRTKYPGLPPEAVSDLEKWFELQRAYYDIPDDQPVYPPLPKQPRPKGKRRATGRNDENHPWRAA